MVIEHQVSNEIGDRVRVWCLQFQKQHHQRQRDTRSLELEAQVLDRQRAIRKKGWPRKM